MPVISAQTQARAKGHSRLEWKLAAQRSHLISDRTAFLLPAVMDANREAEADVPAEFRAVPWTRLPGDDAATAFVARVPDLPVDPTAAKTSPRITRLTQTHWEIRSCA